ncbi:unnamed protein product [Nesidiocoris tenuis]|uniref:Major facilitator superfamily (MFS) profile domain-containing protein n=1 Tax=Nesidiocoris tenuis TaxID=355587 RepID=A0A6H5G2F0_9HEMI|nr:unnamed protein product [Nesidiocoris tenuis]
MFHTQFSSKTLSSLAHHFIGVYLSERRGAAARGDYNGESVLSSASYSLLRSKWKYCNRPKIGTELRKKLLLIQIYLTFSSMPSLAVTPPQLHHNAHQYQKTAVGDLTLFDKMLTLTDWKFGAAMGCEPSRTVNSRCLKPSDMESMGPDVLFHCMSASHVSVTAFASGTTEGWSSPMILILSSEENPINRVLTTSETNKMVTYMKLSSIVNTMLCGFLCDRFGRRSGAWAISFLVPLGWGLLATLSDISGLYVGAALIGSTTISGLVLGIIILSEMADDNVRGSLISIIVFWYSCGVLLAHVLGEICSFHVFNWVGFSISIISAILLYTLPESPQYLILKNRADDARRSLQWYHGSDPTVIEDRMNVRSIQMPFYSYDKMKSLDTQMRLSGEKKWIRLLTECILQEKLSGYDN